VVRHFFKNDATEGNYWAVTGSGTTGRYGIGYDAFFGLTGLNCEVLVRTHMTAFTATNRYFPGPGCNITGSTDAAFRAVLGRLNWSGTPPTTMDFVLINPTAGGGSVLANGTTTQSFDSGDWVWFRMRRQELLIPAAGEARLKMKVWKGDISAEPAAWQVETTAVSVDVADGAVGWTGDWFFSDPNEHGVAFMSFTNDPDVTAPPLPDEIA